MSHLFLFIVYSNFENIFRDIYIRLLSNFKTYVETRTRVRRGKTFHPRSTECKKKLKLPR